MKEFNSLPLEDSRAIRRAIRRYAAADEAGFRIENYGDGLEMLTDGGRGQGRCLFFTRDRSGETENLVILLFYKKESQKAPAAIIAKARTRLTETKPRNDQPTADDFNPDE